MNNHPYFSICVPATGRDKTIFATLASICTQQFKDYEVVITYSSNDKMTSKALECFFSSSVFRDAPFTYSIHAIDGDVTNTSDWNDPLVYATGKYIAMLEGDDQFQPDRLASAFDYIKNHEQLGVYASGNQWYTRKYKGEFSSKRYLTHIYTMREIPPPSECIFIRVDPRGDSYFYNANEYDYAPEIDLYLRIAKDGFSAYHDDKSTVLRDKSTDPLKGLMWKNHKDRFVIQKKYTSFVPWYLAKYVRIKIEVDLIMALYHEALIKSDLFQHTAIYRAWKKIKPNRH